MSSQTVRIKFLKISMVGEFLDKELSLFLVGLQDNL